MNQLDYKTLAGQESMGSIGHLGVRIQVGGSKLPNLDQYPLRRAAREALEKVEQEIIAAILAADPDAVLRTKTEREEILSCFDSPIFVEEIPNQYCHRACCRHLPWFVVTTAVGRIQIGWRKRVISIDWEDTKGTATSGHLFAEENVTKGDHMIHAWSIEDAKRYVAAIIKSGSN